MNGSLDPTYILPTDFKASGNIKLFFDSELEYNRFMGDPTKVTPVMLSSATPAELKLVLKGSVITGNYYNAVTILFPEVYYDKIDYSPANDSFTSAGFDFTAVYNDTSKYSAIAYVQSGLMTIA